MVEQKVRRGEQSTSKSDMSGIKTWTLKRKKIGAVKAAPVVSEPQTAFIPPSRESISGSPKRMKTLMSDNASQTDLTIIILMQDSGSSHQTNPSIKFKSWFNNFDGLRYLYDHLNTI